jgi:hypothetical protein
MAKRATSLMLLFFCLLIVALGCTHSQEPKIIGKWECKATGDRMELLEDHTCKVDSMGFHYPGKWALSKSDVKVEAGQIVLKGSFDGNDITVEEAIMHGKYTFERIVETKS